MYSFTGEEIVLVVDDSPEALALINDTLESQNIDVLVALEGQQALAIAKRIQPTMILLDAVMPKMDGFETCRRLKQDAKLAAVPVIFMTGLTSTSDIVRGLEAGGVDYLTKPIRPDELLARMRVHLKNARVADSTRRALDSSKQNLLATNSAGHILWATPLAFELLNGVKPSADWQHKVFSPSIETWLQAQPTPQQRLCFNTIAQPFAVELIENRGSDDFLLRLASLVKVPEEQLLQHKLQLTKREAEVLRWIARGKTNREIGQILEISPRTVNKHLEQVYEKVGVENRTAAASIAIRVIAENERS